MTHYTAVELRAAVEAAESLGTYLALPACTPRAEGQAIKPIEDPAKDFVVVTKDGKIHQSLLR